MPILTIVRFLPTATMSDSENAEKEGIAAAPHRLKFRFHIFPLRNGRFVDMIGLSC